jgi:hypothetical protein
VHGLINSLRVGMIADPIYGSVTTSTGDLPGATVSILNGTTTVATTDSTGLYYFANTNLLATGTSYTIEVTGFPTGMTSNPSASTFTWSGSGLSFNFSLY